jgi:hypothetical protein
VETGQVVAGSIGTSSSETFAVTHQTAKGSVGDRIAGVISMTHQTVSGALGLEATGKPITHQKVGGSVGGEASSQFAVTHQEVKGEIGTKESGSLTTTLIYVFGYMGEGIVGQLRFEWKEFAKLKILSEVKKTSLKTFKKALRLRTVPEEEEDVNT